MNFKEKYKNKERRENRQIGRVYIVYQLGLFIQIIPNALIYLISIDVHYRQSLLKPKWSNMVVLCCFYSLSLY